MYDHICPYSGWLDIRVATQKNRKKEIPAISAYNTEISTNNFAASTDCQAIASSSLLGLFVLFSVT